MGRVLTVRGKGILGLEKSRIWEGKGSTVLVFNSSKDGQPEVQLHRLSGY